MKLGSSSRLVAEAENISNRDLFCGETCVDEGGENVCADERPAEGFFDLDEVLFCVLKLASGEGVRAARCVEKRVLLRVLE